MLGLMAGTQLYFGQSHGECWMIPARSRPKQSKRARWKICYSRSCIRVGMAVLSQVRINYSRRAETQRAGQYRYFGWLNYPMQIKWTFCAATRFLRAPSSWTRVRFWIWRQRAACVESKSGHFYFKYSDDAPGLFPSMSCSFN